MIKKAKTNLNYWNQLLMIKFDKSKKTGLSDFLFQNIRFWQFQGKAKKGAKIKDLKISGVLKHGKILRSIKEPRWKKSKTKVMAAKTGVSNFSRTDKVRLGFEI
jgi:hypothetical protein